MSSAVLRLQIEVSINFDPFLDLFLFDRIRSKAGSVYGTNKSMIQDADTVGFGGVS